MLFTLALLGCSDAENIIGQVLQGPGLAGAPVAAGEITILHGGSLEVYDTATLDAEGIFEVTGPRGTRIFAVVDGDDIEPTAFTGVVGQGDFVLAPGEIFGWPTTERASLDATFADCSDSGPVVTGEMRLADVIDDFGENPLITAGFARLVREDTIVPACLLDDEGIYDPTATVTGETGAFAIYGAEPGVWTLEYGYFVGENTRDFALTIYVPESGVVPQLPAWVELAF